MKSKNRAEKYFNQKEFSIIEIILIVLSVIAILIATFMQGGIPIGFPILLLCIIGFVAIRASKIKDDEIDQILKRITGENKIEISDTTLSGYELTNEDVKKRKDGKLCSRKYYITNISFQDANIVLNIHILDLIEESVEFFSLTINDNSEISLIDQNINTSIGLKKVFYLKISNFPNNIPVEVNDYKSSELINRLCEK